MCEITNDEADFIVTATLFEAFARWCQLNKYDSMKRQAFGRRVTKLGFESDTKKIDGKARKVRRGLRLVEDSGVHQGS